MCVNDEVAHWVKVLAAFLMTWIRTAGPTRCEERIKSWNLFSSLYTCTLHHHIHYRNNCNRSFFFLSFFLGGDFLLGKCRGVYTWDCHMVRPVFCGPTECQVWSIPPGWVWREPDEVPSLAWWELACTQGHTEENLWQGEGGQQIPRTTWWGKPKTIFPCTEVPTPEPEPGAKRSKEQTLPMGEMSPLKTWHLLLGQAGVSSRVSCINEVNHFV